MALTQDIDPTPETSIVLSPATAQRTTRRFQVDCSSAKNGARTLRDCSLLMSAGALKALVRYATLHQLKALSFVTSQIPTSGT